MRVAFFVNGFNLYHSLRDFHRNDLKWLDIVALCQCLLLDIRSPSVKDAILGDVYYFSAIAKHLEGRSDQIGSPTERHRRYIRAIEHFGAKPRLSRFKQRRRGGIVYHEEKGTDVWLAATLMESVLLRRCDAAVIVSGDTDFAPAARMARATASRHRAARNQVPTLPGQPTPQPNPRRSGQRGGYTTEGIPTRSAALQSA